MLRTPISNNKINLRFRIYCSAVFRYLNSKETFKETETRQRSLQIDFITLEAQKRGWYLHHCLLKSTCELNGSLNKWNDTKLFSLIESFERLNTLFWQGRTSHFHKHVYNFCNDCYLLLGIQNWVFIIANLEKSPIYFERFVFLNYNFKLGRFLEK